MKLNPHLQISLGDRGAPSTEDKFTMLDIYSLIDFKNHTEFETSNR